VDARIIGAGKPGPITQKLQAAFFDVVKGKDPKYQQWLTYI
jgi:branched-chain amino acid aminotransferase